MRAKRSERGTRQWARWCKHSSIAIGVAALFSCSPGQRAFESKKAGGGHGIFFHFVWKACAALPAMNVRGNLVPAFGTGRRAVESGVHEWIGPDIRRSLVSSRTFAASHLSCATMFRSHQMPRRPAFQRSSPTVARNISQASELRFQYIPVGSFVMGAPRASRVRSRKNRPAHGPNHQTVSHEHHRSLASPVCTVMRTVNPNFANPSNFQRDDLPAENVSWIDAIVFCKRIEFVGQQATVLSHHRHRCSDCHISADGDGYRLPTKRNGNSLSSQILGSVFV